MKSHWLAFALIFLRAASVPAVAAEAPSAPSADMAWAEIRALGLLEYQPAGAAGETSVRRRLELQERHQQLLREKGLAFYAAFPDDPRRWSLVWRMSQNVPRFIVAYGPDIDRNIQAAEAGGDTDAVLRAKLAASGDVKVDAAAAAAWKSRLAELEAALRAAPDQPADVREALATRAFFQEARPLFAGAGPGRPPDWAALRAKMLDFTARFPESAAPADLMSANMYAFEAAHTPAEAAAAWRRFADFPYEPLAEKARGKARAFEAISRPVELAFTALDGRAVDVAKLRGKVVLLDFWATWCGPCMMEMPNVKKVYAAYHDKGFEIVGISCDVAPEGAMGSWVKAARTGPQVLEFCQKNDMPWPEHYDGKKHNEGGNSLAARFAVTGIPAAFLLDQTGQVVGLNLRGEALELEVKRLLKL
ncbi:MAG: TlpA family protein disulfide reductase [Opitutae bacterium]|nr:TlpA family protein disulfide reductase [Opitutae bacterium]